MVEPSSKVFKLIPPLSSLCLGSEEKRILAYKVKIKQNWRPENLISMADRVTQKDSLTPVSQRGPPKSPPAGAG